MTELETHIKNLNVCLLIPTYNHASLLEGVINDCIQYPIDIIIVNDGSTDETLALLHSLFPYQFPHTSNLTPNTAYRTPQPAHRVLHLVSYEKNRGKGYALKQGAKKTIELGYKAMITMDSDGQHFALNIETIVNAALKNPYNIIVGSRGLQHDNMPKKNSFANKFANFWLAVQTFQKIPDTQSGFRYYPLQCFQKKIWFTNRYNFELEILVRNIWRGISISSVPIQVYYAPIGERITHFKPALDFFRISVLNTFLSIFAVVYFYPKKLFKYISSHIIDQK